MKTIEYFLREKNEYISIYRNMLLDRLEKNLQKHNRDVSKLNICERNVALRTISPSSQIYYYDMFINNRGKERDLWMKIRAHEYERVVEACLGQEKATNSGDINNLISEELVEQLLFSCRYAHRREIVVQALDYIANEYLSKEKKGFVPYKICAGIQEMDFVPVFDVIGMQGKQTMIASFVIGTHRSFTVGQTCVIKVGKKIKLKCKD